MAAFTRIEAQAALAPDVARTLAAARTAQAEWANTPVSTRAAVLRALRHRIAHDSLPLVEAIQCCRESSSLSEILTSEVMPFLDALKFAERNAAALLQPRRMGSKRRPFWLSGVGLEVHREPFGVVLVIAPSNYPLFLAGVHVMQALIAGNAAILKPGPGGERVMEVLQRLAIGCGLPTNIFSILHEAPQNASAAIREGVDKVVLTGSAETGRAVLRLAAESLTPLVCELSGCDAVIVLPGADPELVARALRFGLQLNGSRTCMRPHRVIAHESVAATLMARTFAALSDLTVTLDHRTAADLEHLATNAARRGANKVCGTFLASNRVTPFLFEEVPPTSELWNADIFAPVLCFSSYRTAEDAIRMHNDCRYALTAAVFGPEGAAQTMARQLDVGTVIINDLIVPTADARLPFSGRKHSGFDVTRGEQGLLAMTQLKAVSTRRSAPRHLHAPQSSDDEIFRGAIAAAHAKSLSQRLRGIVTALGAIAKRSRENPR